MLLGYVFCNLISVLSGAYNEFCAIILTAAVCYMRNQSAQLFVLLLYILLYIYLNSKCSKYVPFQLPLQL